VIDVVPTAQAGDNRTVVLRLAAEQDTYHVGCPSQSLVVIGR
jgi:hypothetical protein